MEVSSVALVWPRFNSRNGFSYETLCLLKFTSIKNTNNIFILSPPTNETIFTFIILLGRPDAIAESKQEIQKSCSGDAKRVRVDKKQSTSVKRQTTSVAVLSNYTDKSNFKL